MSGTWDLAFHVNWPFLHLKSTSNRLVVEYLTWQTNFSATLNHILFGVLNDVMSMQLLDLAKCELDDIEEDCIYTTV